jgi:hypothetical protein
MPCNRRREPIGRESSVYLYGASRREVRRKVDPVGYHLRLFVIRFSTPRLLARTEECGPHKTRRRVGACSGLTTNRDRRIPLSFRWCARCVAANPPKPSSLSSSSPAIDALRGLEPRPAIRARIPETVFLVSKPKPNRQFLDCGELSPNSLEFLLRLFPTKRHSRRLSERPKLRYSSL